MHLIIAITARYWGGALRGFLGKFQIIQHITVRQRLFYGIAGQLGNVTYSPSGEVRI